MYDRLKAVSFKQMDIDIIYTLSYNENCEEFSLGCGEKYKLDAEEKQILKDVEAGKFVSVPNVKQEIARIQRIARAQFKTKNINLRLSEKDVNALKEKAAANSLPYQTLVATLIRQYLSGKFKIIL